MPLGTANISISLVRNILGENNNDVGRLCTSNNINKWALNKPISLKPPPVTVMDGDLPHDHGIYRISTLATSNRGEIYYNRPKGGQTDPYRLGDFREYSHGATAPTNVTINSVFETLTQQYLEKPYVLIPGFSYDINYTLSKGQIDPATISRHTKWEKDPYLNYGGVALAKDYSYDAEIMPEGVDDVPVTNRLLNFQCGQGDADLKPFKFYYCERDGSIYKTTMFRTEEEAYLDDISVNRNAFGIYISNIKVVKESGLTRIQVTVKYSNNIPRAFKARIAIQSTYENPPGSSPTNPPNSYVDFTMSAFNESELSPPRDLTLSTEGLAMPSGTLGEWDVKVNATPSLFVKDEGASSEWFKVAEGDKVSEKVTLDGIL